jgi:hypothetical protein
MAGKILDYDSTPREKAPPRAIYSFICGTVALAMCIFGPAVRVGAALGHPANRRYLAVLLCTLALSILGLISAIVHRIKSEGGMHAFAVLGAILCVMSLIAALAVIGEAILVSPNSAPLPVPVEAAPAAAFLATPHHSGSGGSMIQGTSADISRVTAGE